jgi:hypothetical protein
MESQETDIQRIEISENISKNSSELPAEAILRIKKKAFLCKTK